MRVSAELIGTAPLILISWNEKDLQRLEFQGETSEGTLAYRISMSADQNQIYKQTQVKNFNFTLKKMNYDIWGGNKLQFFGTGKEIAVI